ncbi:hypothetical protein BDBG_06869 [Blastomyces gilchristii SLH14081]|uniref:Uncharacterized protein n=1 Tax=Blastomyces gilchristii (strain SLH14081) TaxID=559298 RepID=A0A179UU85_BLAGS|nr:uncharacterized protein BDBG_06869 [Blastomyces gilchristii SLH14081]OAT11363.1 hypothetical protein BDBG_06869 [Blastomyces gilchristii SLH14081]
MDLWQQTNMPCRAWCTSCECSYTSQLTCPVGQLYMPDNYPHTLTTFSDASNSQYSIDKQATPHVHVQQDEGPEPPEIFQLPEDAFLGASPHDIAYGSSSAASKNFSQDIDIDRLACDKSVKYLGVKSGGEPLPAVSNCPPPKAFQKQAQCDFTQTNIPTEFRALPQTYSPQLSTQQYTAPPNQAGIGIATDEGGLRENWEEFDHAFLAANWGHGSAQVAQEAYSLSEPDNGLMMSFQQDDYNTLMRAPRASYASEIQQLYREGEPYHSISYTQTSRSR